MRRWAGLAAAALLVMPAATPVAAQGGLQARYAAAQAAFDAGRWQEAYDGFTAILPQLRGASASVVRARAGSAAVKAGNPQAAAPLIEAALPGLTGDERLLALVDLGGAREQLVEPDAARAAYAEAARQAGADLPPPVRLGLVRSTALSDPAFARATMDAGMAALEALYRDKPETMAQILALRGRIELNDGKPKEARDWFERALKAAGGLSRSQVSIPDVRIRGDLAIAAYLMGDQTGARRYLAYTGAGSLAEKGFDTGADTPLPNCLPGALEPDDMAIIELAIGGDGRVIGVDTVYASRKGQPAVAFARAARDWSWQPETAAKMPPWWRSAVRLEVRCVTGRAPGPGPGLFAADLAAWLAAKGVPPVRFEGAEAVTLPLLQAELAKREAAGGGLATLPVLLALGENRAATVRTQADAYERARDLALAQGAPEALAVFLRAQAVNMRQAVTKLTRMQWRFGARERVAQLEALVATLAGEGRLNNRGGAYALLLLGATQAAAGDEVAAGASFVRIVAMPDSAVPADDPMRQLALLQKANVAAATNRLEEAKALFSATGLSADQCALIDLRPAVRRAGGNASDFPHEAQQWGFEGVVRVAHDVDAEGRVTGTRTVMASPPLVFGPASERVVGRMRYDPVFRPDGGTGCAGLEQTVKFGIRGL
ncbi:energy transducer TonB [Sandaracinobacteroides saxicola]